MLVRQKKEVKVQAEALIERYRVTDHLCGVT